MSEESNKSLDPVAAPDGAPRFDIAIKDDPARKVTLVALKGRIDVFNYLQLSSALTDAAGGRQGLSLILDLSEVGFIASSGWSVLLGIRSRLKRSESKLVLVGLNPQNERIYQAMKLPVLIASYPSVAQAEAALGLA